MSTKTMKQYVIDAFTDHVFAGNPAAVCVMDAWLPEDTMMAITRENNLSETAFAVKEGGTSTTCGGSPPAAIRLLRPLKASRSMPRPCWEKMVSIRSWTHWLQYRSRESGRWSYRAYFGIHKVPGARLRVLRSLAPDL